jgi:hypothetical protein
MLFRELEYLFLLLTEHKRDKSPLISIADTQLREKALNVL